jgi:Predicted membrane protein
MQRITQLIHTFRQPHVIRQLIKYGVSGGATVGTDYGTFTLLYALKASLIVATVASLLAGFVVSFTLNRLWVFGAKKEKADKSVRLQIGLYVSLLAVNTTFTYIFILYVTRWTGVSAYVAKLMAIALIMVWNYFAYKKVIFRLIEADN